MYKKIFSALALFFISANSYAHYMWIETSPAGQIGQKQEVRVHFGEYTYGVVEKTGDEAFEKVNKFDLWVISPDGKKTTLKVSPEESYYRAEFTPESEGTYTLLMNNNNIDVIDYTQYDFGIFKTHYHAVAKVEVGDKASETVIENPEGITVKDVSKSQHKKDGEVHLQVFYRGKALADNELTVFVADQWSKELKTDENGKVSFRLPWNAKYIVETTYKEEVPGKYKGEDYEFVWHCATYCLLPE